MTDEMRAGEHKAVDGLLPWYVNETLNVAERARVRRHLDQCGDCRDSVSLLARVNSVVGRPAATPILPVRRPDLLLREVERFERGGARPWRRPALAMAASFAVGAAGLLLLWPDREAGVPDEPAYETATSPPQRTSMAYVMSLEFEPGVGREEREWVLDELGTGAIWHDETAGTWQIDVTLPAGSLEELSRFTAVVEARPEVRSARIVALRLPMEPPPTPETERGER